MKTLYRRVSGKVVASKVSDRDADKLITKGWLSEDPTAPKPKRGRPKKVKPDELDEA